MSQEAQKAGMQSWKMPSRFRFRRQRLKFLQWCLTTKGFQILCRCECGWLAVVRPGDFAHRYVTGCLLCETKPPVPPQLRKWLGRICPQRDADGKRVVV